MDHSPTPNLTQDDEIDLFELWATLVAGKTLILKIALVCVLLATAAAFVMTPKYEAKVVFHFADQDKSSNKLSGQFGGLADLAGIGLRGNTNDANMAYLNSRGFIESFIRDENLLPILFEKRWDDEKKSWKESPSIFFGPPSPPPSLWNGYDFFVRKITSIDLDKKTNIATLTILWKNREQAVSWANNLVKKANENLRQRTIEETQRSLDYLNKELEKTSVVDVQNTIFKVMENQIKTMMMANTQDEFAFKIIDPAIMVDEDAFVKPKRPLIIALGLFGGLFLGVLTVFVRKALHNRKAGIAP